MKYAKLVIPFLLFLSVSAQAGLLFNYSQLLVKDLDEMNKLVLDKIKESKKSYSGKVVPLKEALQAVYSRPNDDEMIDKVIAPLRSNLDEIDAWEKSLSALTDEAINALKHTKPFKPVVQMTYVVFLENLLSELKPYAKKDGFERALMIRIRDANIQLTKDAINERRIRTMKDTTSPSEIAKNILLKIDSESTAEAKLPESSSENDKSGN